MGQTVVAVAPAQLGENPLRTQSKAPFRATLKEALPLMLQDVARHSLRGTRCEALVARHSLRGKGTVPKGAVLSWKLSEALRHIGINQLHVFRRTAARPVPNGKDVEA